MRSFRRWLNLRIGGLGFAEWWLAWGCGRGTVFSGAELREKEPGWSLEGGLWVVVFGAV